MIKLYIASACMGINSCHDRHIMYIHDTINRLRIACSIYLNLSENHKNGLYNYILLPKLKEPLYIGQVQLKPAGSEMVLIIANPHDNAYVCAPCNTNLIEHMQEAMQDCAEAIRTKSCFLSLPLHC